MPNSLKRLAVLSFAAIAMLAVCGWAVSNRYRTVRLSPESYVKTDTWTGGVWFGVRDELIPASEVRKQTDSEDVKALARHMSDSALLEEIRSVEPSH